MAAKLGIATDHSISLWPMVGSEALGLDQSPALCLVSNYVPSVQRSRAAVRMKYLASLVDVDRRISTPTGIYPTFPQSD